MIPSDEIRRAKALIRAHNREKRAQRVRAVGEPKLSLTPGPATQRRFTTAQRRNAYVNQDGFCARCEAGPFLLSDMEMDHRIPLALGGEESDTNHEMLCAPCHKIKTKADIRQIAKAKRQAKLHGPRNPSRMRSRGFG